MNNPQSRIDDILFNVTNIDTDKDVTLAHYSVHLAIFYKLTLNSMTVTS